MVIELYEIHTGASTPIHTYVGRYMRMSVGLYMALVDNFGVLWYAFVIK